MATNFKITEMKRQPTSGGHYEKESEHHMELRRIAALEKELKKHESQSAEKAHGQKSAPLPNMRSY
jgi:50S ribosomal subunit-associated GTPase HflX